MSTTQVQTMSSYTPVMVYRTSIGKKVLMAVTGVVFIGFVIGHMIGNLQIFIGQNQINSYAEKLQSLGPILWLIRIFLISFFAIHIWFGIKLWIENQQARPVSYVKEENVKSTFSSRFMIWSGGLMFFFVLYHLLHFTLIVTNPEYADLRDGQGRFDVFSMMVLGFQNIWISLTYGLSMLFLAFHVNHGVWSLFQTFGINDGKWLPRLQRLGNIVAVLVFLGYISIPAAVLSGIITLPAGGGN